MPGTEPLTGARIPTQSDGPLGGLQIANAVTDLRTMVTPRFATVADRDAAYSAFTTTGGVVKNGMSCWTDDAGFWRRAGGVWKADKTTGLLSLASGWGQYNNYPLPGYHLDVNGKVTAHGAMLRTSGGNIAVTGSGLLIGSLPAAIRPSGDMAPRVYFGSGSPVQRVSGVLYVDSTSAGLMQLLPFDGGTYTINQGSGFVSFDGLTWYI